MNNKSRLILIVLLLFVPVSYPGLLAQKFEVEILQYGKIIEVVDDVVELEKKEFQIRITLKKQDGVFMNASFKKDYFKLKADEPINDYEFIGQKTMAEIEFNSHKELFVHDEYVTYLFFDKTMDWHRFDKGVVKRGKKIIASKTVQIIKNIHNKEITELVHLEKDIYLFFVAQDSRSKEKPPKELGRYKIHIKWK